MQHHRHLTRFTLLLEPERLYEPPCSCLVVGLSYECFAEPKPFGVRLRLRIFFVGDAETGVAKAAQASPSISIHVMSVRGFWSIRGPSCLRSTERCRCTSDGRGSSQPLGRSSLTGWYMGTVHGTSCKDVRVEGMGRGHRRADGQELAPVPTANA